MTRIYVILSMILATINTSIASSTEIPIPIKRKNILIPSNLDWAPTPDIPLPLRNPYRKTLGNIDITSWPESDIVKAQQACMKIFSTINIQFATIPPIRKGRCGTPAPIRLKSLGDKPEVQITPSARVNCNIAKAIHKWITEKVQPIAKELLNTSIISVRNLSSYSCRTRYSNPLKRISEHAFANALDISGFTTTEGKFISILKHWGPTKRDLIVQNNVKHRNYDKKSENIVNSIPTISVKNSNSKIKNLAIEIKNAIPLPIKRSQVGLNSIDKYAEFLHAIHKVACGIFGTVLGPESNEAHRDHFHFDLAPRKYGAFCE